jgi:hypothetical protein
MEAGGVAAAAKIIARLPARLGARAQLDRAVSAILHGFQLR